MSEHATPTRPILVVVLGLALGLGALAALFVTRTKPIATDVASDGTLERALRRVNAEDVIQWAKIAAKSSPSGLAVVNLWATWCEPCRTEMPELAKFNADNQAPVLLISADNEADETSVLAFLKQSGVTFESGIVAGDQQIFTEAWQKFSSADPDKQWSMTLPATFLIDANGAMRKMVVGSVSRTELQQLIENLKGR